MHVCNFIGGRVYAVKVAGSIPVVTYKFRIKEIIILVCLIKQPNGTVSQMCVQKYMSLLSKACNKCSIPVIVTLKM